MQPRIKATAVSSALLALLLTMAAVLVSISPAKQLTAVTVPHGSVVTGIQSASISPTSSTSFGSRTTQARIADLKQTGANSVTLTFANYMASTTSCAITRSGNTPTDGSLASATHYARSIGLQVIWQPLIEVRDGTWRANINPQGATRTCWWNNFTNLQTRYARMAQSNHVSLIIIGTEMVKMASQHMNASNGGHWLAIIRNNRSVYHGKMCYSAQRDQRDSHYGEANTSSLAFASKLDYFCISAYYPMIVSGTPSVAKYQAQWSYFERTQIRPIYAHYHKPILFSEVGFRSVTGAHTAPADYNLSGKVNLAEQAQLYQALLGFWNRVSYFRGLSLWQWDATTSPGGTRSTAFTPQGKPALAVLRQYYGGSTPVAAPKPKPTVKPKPTTPAKPRPTTTPKPSTSPKPVSSPAASSAALTVWWPTKNAKLSGCQQPFKALLPGASLATYATAWRVDGGQWNPMYNSGSGGDHKEAIVNVTRWGWHGTGPYMVEFQATDRPSGTVHPLTAVSVYTLGTTTEVCPAA